MQIDDRDSDAAIADANLGPSASREAEGNPPKIIEKRASFRLRVVSGRKELHANDETEN